MKTHFNIPLRIATIAFGFSWVAASGQVVEADETALRSVGAKKAVVLLDIYWARVWRCGRYENAQLRSLSFERAPLSQSAENATPSLVFESPSRLSPLKNFTPYAVVVEPGEYHLTGFQVGFARSVSNVGETLVTRSESIVDSRSKFGSFTVSAGEFVYIGNFAVDCYKDPIPWRYYTQGKKDFTNHLSQYKAKYPALPVESVVYRLFSTSALGEAYELK